jgi:phosphate starvation-inducible membrane PsiE
MSHHFLFPLVCFLVGSLYFPFIILFILFFFNGLHLSLHYIVINGISSIFSFTFFVI